MTTFNEALHPRETRGRFATKTTAEADGGLGALAVPGEPLPAAPHPYMVPSGTTVVAVRQDGQWVHGRVRDDELDRRGLVTLHSDGARIVCARHELVVDVDPAQYDGDDVDTLADVFGWAAKEWETYYDADEVREVEHLQSVDGVADSIDAMAPPGRAELYEQLAARPAELGPDGQVRVVVSTSGQDLRVDHRPVPEWPRGVPEPELSLEYGDSGNLVVRVRVGDDTVDVFDN